MCVIRPLTASARRPTVAGGLGSGPAAMEESLNTLNVRNTTGEVNINGFQLSIVLLWI